MDLFRHNTTMVLYAVKFVPRGESMTAQVEREVRNPTELNARLARVSTAVSRDPATVATQSWRPGGRDEPPPCPLMLLVLPRCVWTWLSIHPYPANETGKRIVMSGWMSPGAQPGHAQPPQGGALQRGDAHAEKPRRHQRGAPTPPPFLGGFATVATNHHACASSHRRDHLISHPRAS